MNFINVWLISFVFITFPFQLYSSYELVNFFIESEGPSVYIQITGALFCGLAFYIYSWFAVYSLRRVIQLGKPISLNWDELVKGEDEEIEMEDEEITA